MGEQEADGARSDGADAAVPVYVREDAPAFVIDAVRRGGGLVCRRAEEARAVVWDVMDPAGFREVLHDGVTWVQLPSAGVDRWLGDGLLDDRRTWTSAAGAYAHPVAEHATALVIAASRRLHEHTDVTTWDSRWSHAGSSLAGATMVIVGCGGTGRELIRMLAPFDVEVVAVTRRGAAVAGASRSYSADQLGAVWPMADYVVLLAPATRETRHLVGRAELDAMKSTAWLVNVARGPLVDSTALVEALDRRAIGGAALDVTEPEPLLPGHRLWEQSQVILTPHVACNPSTMRAGLARRIQANVERRRTGRQLLGRVDVHRGY